MMFRSDTSILDAATNGALAAIPIVLGIIANIVAFVSFVAFLNAMLFWFGGLVGYEALSLEVKRTKREFLTIDRDRAQFDDCDFTDHSGKSIYAAKLDHGCPLGTLRRRGHIDRPQDSGQ